MQERIDAEKAAKDLAEEKAKEQLAGFDQLEQN